MKSPSTDRRKFLKQSTQLGLGASGLVLLPSTSSETMLSESSLRDTNIIGPKEGFTPQVGTLVSMMNWMRGVVVRSIRGLSIEDLDYIHDKGANSIGAMLWHLAAVERFYQRDTFGTVWKGLSKSDDKLWDMAQNLGDQAREQIKGYDLNFYQNMLRESRAFSIAEMKKRDDAWLMESDNFWGSPTNNYCKWFHVVEHESNHNGQIKFIKARIQ